jgi:hypothetical protein
MFVFVLYLRRTCRPGSNIGFVAKDHLLQHSLSVAGALHILHNMVKYITDSMPNFFELFWPGFKALVTWLRRRDCRKFMIHHCFSKPPADQLQHLFRSFTASLSDHRWGYLVGSASQVAPLQFALQQYWDGSAMRKAPVSNAGDASDASGDSELETQDLPPESS